MKKIVYCLSIFSLLFFSCSSKEVKAVKQFEAMNTWMSIQGWGSEKCEEALDEAELAIRKLEASISTTNPASEIYALPLLTDGSESKISILDLSPEVFNLAQYALNMAEKTNGAFNPCLYPVTQAWGFTTGKYTVPTEYQLTQLLKDTDYSSVQINSENQLEVPSGMMLDFGGIGKGYAGDIAIAKMKSYGLTAGLLDLGGNIQAFGTKPDGTPWKIGIRNPVGQGVIAGLEIQTGAVITSGGYERYFTTDDGKKYIHIIDPETGRPVDNGLVSVTIVAKDGVYADALSTALFVMGEKKAINFWKENTDEDFQFIIIKQTQENELVIYVSEGLKDSFMEIENQDNADLKKQIIIVIKQEPEMTGGSSK